MSKYYYLKNPCAFDYQKSSCTFKYPKNNIRADIVGSSLKSEKTLTISVDGKKNHLFKAPSNSRELNEIMKKVRFKFQYQHQWVQLRKKLRQDLNAQKAKTWEECVRPKIRYWLLETISDHADSVDDNCIDNYRAACMSVSRQVRRYRKTRAKGCCGFYDTIVRCPIDGCRYLIGFNYGH